MSDQTNDQLARIADKLDEISQKLDRNPSPVQAKPISPDTSRTLDSILDSLSESFSEEVTNITQSALEQLQGARPADLPPDQLYGWADALSQQLGNRPTAPTDEIRQLQELIEELKRK